MRTIRTILRCFGVLAASAILNYGYSQDFPSRPVRIVVPNAPGSQGELVPRAMAPEMSKALGQPIVVEPRPGGNGLIGLDYVAKQVPSDGYTLTVVALPTLAGLPVIAKDLRFDPLKDLPPVSTLVSSRLFLLTPANAPWKSLTEMVSHAKANPGKLNYGAATISAQLRTEALLRHYGINVTHVPYKSTPDIVRGMAGGEIHMTWVGFSLIKGMGDKLRSVAVTGETRHPGTPEAPTFKELGLYIPGADYSLNAPAGTPKGIVDKLHAAVLKALQNTDVKAQLEKMEFEVVGDTPEAAQKRLVDESKLYSEIAQRIGYRRK